MSKEKAFITGPTQGLPTNNLEEFEFVAELLANKGYAVTIPQTLYEGADTRQWTQEDFLNIRVAAIRNSDCLILLEGWKSDAIAFRDEEAARMFGVKIHLAKNILSQYAERYPQ